MKAVRSPETAALALALASAVAVAVSGCTGLLDLDVVYADGGATAREGGSDDGTDGATPNSDAGDAQTTADAPASGGADATPDAPGNPGSDAGLDAAPDAPLDAAGDAPIDAGPAGPGIGVAQTSFGSGENVAAVDVDYDDDVQSGSALVIGVEYTSDVTLAITDALGNTFAREAFVASGHDNGYRGEVWVALGSPAGPDTVHVVVPSGGSGGTVFYIGAYIHEFTNVGAVDGASSNFGPGNVTDIESGDITTTADQDLLFGYAITGTASLAPGYTMLRNDEEDLTSYRYVPTPSVVQAAAVGDGTNVWAMMGVALKPLYAQ
ncbi:MAG TPA: hypothetical protein VHV30_01700 [Polyangiaceae bacterium]|jgi:hypothetical protein|nr:hypothetical protein [Polyangiaceae bacterium]